MNIKIDKDLKEYLDTIIVKTVVIGSKLYGTSDENSDTDYLHIIKAEKLGLNEASLLVYPLIHQFQYDDKENNEQHLYTLPYQFLRNAISGESTINVEAMFFTDVFKKQKEFDLTRFRTYKVLKAYLGLAKRDCRQIRKRRKHIVRALYMVKTLLKGEEPNLEDLRNEMMTNTQSGKELREEVATLRSKITQMYNDGVLPLYGIPQSSNPLDNPSEVVRLLLESNNIKEFKYN